MRRFAGVVITCMACVALSVRAGGAEEPASRLKQPGEPSPASQAPEQPGGFTAYPPDGPMLGGPDPHSGDGPWGEPCDSCCEGSCCPPCSCNSRTYFWGRAEYLSWWVRGSNTPPLVTTSPNGTPVGQAGILPGATVLFGNERIDGQDRSGGRFTLGYWLDNCRRFGIEDTFFFLGTANQSFNISSDGAPILARPFFNVISPNPTVNSAPTGPNALIVAFPGIGNGTTIGVNSNSRLLGNELNLRRAIYVDCCRRIDVLAGYRFVHLEEGLTIGTTFTSQINGGTPPPPPVGTVFDLIDSFSTRNQFNGGQIGFNVEYRGCRWGLDWRLKLAMGAVSQRVEINGSTRVTEPPAFGVAPVTNVGGLLALPSNIGHFSREQFGVLPEFGVNLNYQLTPLWRATVGYTLLGLTNVVRPGDQIDTRINSDQIPGLPTSTTAAGPFTFPMFAFHNSDLLVQGVNVGLECNF